MIINNNLSAMNAHRQLGVNQGMAAKAQEKLSSGLRINKAGDDAAGLAISEKMRAQVRGLDQASRNSQDGISMIQTAEGALSETHSILQRMRELATQAANGTNTDQDRQNIQDEINSLTSEINRIGNTTEFNGQKLLNGASSIETNQTVNSIAGPATATSGVGSIDLADVTIAEGNTFIINGETFTAIAADETAEGNQFNVGADAGASIDNLRTAIGANDNFNSGGTGTTITVTEAAASGENFTFSSNVNDIELTQDTPSQLAATAGEATLTLSDNLKAGTVISVNGTDFTAVAQGETAGANQFVIGEDAGATAANLANAIGGIASATDNVITLTEATPSGENFDVKVTSQFSSTFQIGANQGQSLSLNIADMRADALNLTTSLSNATQAQKDSLGVTNGTNSDVTELALDVSTHESAAQAITTIQSAIDKVSNERSNLGANQNRLEHTISNLNNSSENLQAAESRIRDVDMAKEIMEFTKQNILSQASQSMLAQANQAPQQVLQLLG
ncbi:flagellin [Alkalihalobacillus xiaoxiensis]|uniref:Flagellin n=1 Tax=Shouchella xiaoxiensis TaxID=766895 RepID=A0ABS2SWG6_9BACI|nr:flagellin [Shouchella xiaoxiensis]MBM7839570.1 flagellin [Shouchella xiaoxiensis]